MTTISPDVRADLLLLRRQTDEVHAALANTHKIGAERGATVLRLRDAGVQYRLIAAAMGGSVAAVQGIISRALVQRMSTPAAHAPPAPAPVQPATLKAGAR
ncbi:hypothetical protein [Mycolicibacterium lutetiense]|uniref:ANTAR domain-containing protein n=1 Tax=Mycolicibacterium lutetiense TaxID=1641992 RepID=A0ABS4ZSN5_9MYCO|nr:hypothetical protein [Mycolicibacterium lutetiense]MBP2452493.1 hypothetical protein [Mycolicibacterium lutetiense]